MLANPEERELILDVRPEEEFLRQHATGAVNIPLEALAERTHELPPKQRRFVVYDSSGARAGEALSRLRAGGRSRAEAASGEEWMKARRKSAGPSPSRLWEPHALLVEALDHGRELWGDLTDKRALDLACGAGRDAVFMGLQGLTVKAWDILPDALQRCRSLAMRNGVGLRARCVDVEKERAIIPGEYDLITCFNFLHRPLMPDVAAGIRPGGLVVYETFLAEQARRFDKPQRDSHLLRPGELPGFFKGWDILHHQEGEREPGRIVASLIAGRP